MDVLHQFGIEGKLLVVQLINFAIAVLVVWKFALPRITKLMDQRKQQIADQLKAAENAKRAVEKAKAERETEHAKSREEADRLLKESKAAADEARNEILGRARQDAEEIRTRADRQLAVERKRLREELRAELASLTVETTRKVLSDVVRPGDRQRMVKEATRYLKRKAKKSARR
jgi:F-type H+-transporting ATPase subunit b